MAAYRANFVLVTRVLDRECYPRTTWRTSRGCESEAIILRSSRNVCQRQPERSFVLSRSRFFYLQFHYTSRCSEATPINSVNYYFSNCIIKLLFKRAGQFSIVRGILLHRTISRINVICLLGMERWFRGRVINRKPATKIGENGTKVARRERD